MKRHSERGAVLVETALVVGIILTFLLFSVQMGILGFLQVTADAGAFVAARVATISTANPSTYTSTHFSQLAPADVATPLTVPAPVSTVPVNYGYNVPNADPNQYQFHRTGGYSQLQPVLKQVTVTPSKVLSIAGLMGHVNGTAAEASWTECGAHFNVAGSTNACGAGGQPTNFQTDYFANGENTPPYYLGFNQVEECLSQLPWGRQLYGQQDGICPSGGNTPGSGFFSLGVAEALTAANWNRATPGVTLPTDVFYAAGCHQQFYAAMANLFQAYPTLRQMYVKNYSSLYNQLLFTRTNTFSTWTGFSDPAFPGANHDLDTIYSWDEVVIQGSPLGQNRTSPEAGCGTVQ